MWGRTRTPSEAEKGLDVVRAHLSRLMPRVRLDVTMMKVMARDATLYSARVEGIDGGIGATVEVDAGRLVVDPERTLLSAARQLVDLLQAKMVERLGDERDGADESGFHRPQIFTETGWEPVMRLKPDELTRLKNIAVERKAAGGVTVTRPEDDQELAAAKARDEAEDAAILAAQRAQREIEAANRRKAEEVRKAQQALAEQAAKEAAELVAVKEFAELVGNADWGQF